MSGVPDVATFLRTVPEHTAAFDAGLRGGEHVSAVNGESVNGWSDMRLKLVGAVLDKKPAKLDYEQADGAHGSATLALEGVALKDIEGNFMTTLGVAPVNKPQINEVLPGGAAQRAGLLEGDLILGIDGKAVGDTNEVIKIISASAGKSLRLSIRRGNANQDLTVVPEQTKDGNQTVGRINIQMGGIDTVIVSHGLIPSLGLGVKHTWDMSVLQVTMISKMITGAISWRNINGVISIADYAGQAAQQGMMTYMNFLAAISIAIGVMNLLPIPVLDGGLLLYYSLEVLTRRPIPRRFGEIAQIAGIAMLATLMTVALFNDFTRHNVFEKIAELVHAV